MRSTPSSRKPPVSERGQRGEKADRRAAVGQEQFRLARRNPAAATDDGRVSVRVRVGAHVHSQPLQRIDHHARVFAVQRPVQYGRAVGQGGTDRAPGW